LIIPFAPDSENYQSIFNSASLYFCYPFTTMNIEQIYTGCLAQGAYYITSNGEAAIIDPLREIQPYLDRAARDGVKIKYIFETHFHADFVSGHLDLSKATGAPIVYGPTATPEFESIIATDGQEFPIGNVVIKALHTPGHTMESTVYLLKDESGKDHCIFSGDTLFLGDVGRPDLAQKAAHLTQEELAGLLYDSLMNKIMPHYNQYFKIFLTTIVVFCISLVLILFSIVVAMAHNDGSSLRTLSTGFFIPT
jgi:glyoxylase-like metal-dependent hydrolase (beta-lactamase superfamily II)